MVSTYASTGKSVAVVIIILSAIAIVCNIATYIHYAASDQWNYKLGVAIAHDAGVIMERRGYGIWCGVIIINVAIVSIIYHSKEPKPLKSFAWCIMFISMAFSIIMIGLGAKSVDSWKGSTQICETDLAFYTGYISCDTARFRLAMNCVMMVMGILTFVLAQVQAGLMYAARNDGQPTLNPV